ncbi:hypothetical protein [Nocardioides sp. MH1]|uniref:hypothetical protein n=1 Tax=Nocardioides sp. MH1 TaxID=3242490 RepID=UPI003522C621
MTPNAAPEEAGDGLHSLTLVLSMQRSGSTLLGRDIESLGGLGIPREHLRGLDKQSRPPSESDVLRRLGDGVDEADPGVTGLKLQVHQVRSVCRAVTGGQVDGTAEAAAAVVDWAFARFDRVFLVVLVRNALDTAISQVVVKETGTFLSTKPALREAGAPLPVIEDVNRRILDELQKVLRQRAALQAVATEYADSALLVTYEQLTTELERTTERIIEHARAQSFEPREAHVTRTLEKLISAEQSETLREGFLDFLRTEPGL